MRAVKMVVRGKICVIPHAAIFGFWRILDDSVSIHSSRDTVYCRVADVGVCLAQISSNFGIRRMAARCNNAGNFVGIFGVTSICIAHTFYCKQFTIKIKHVVYTMNIRTMEIV